MGYADRFTRAHTSTGLITGREEINAARRRVADPAVSSLIGSGPSPAISVPTRAHRHTTYDWLAYENKSLINRSQWVYFCPFSTFDSHPNQVKSLPTVLDAKRHTDWHTTRVANCVSHTALLGRSILQPVWFSRNMQTIQNTHFLLYVYFQFIFNTKSISI